MKHFVLFTHGTYRKQHLAFYKKLCRGKIKVAVDGGLSFFARAKITPDILIGDLDSAGRHLSLVTSKTTVITFPTRKDKTDSQLAVEHAIAEGARAIDMVVPGQGQPDHFVANLLLPTLAGVSSWARRGGKFTMVNPAYEASYVNDGRLSYSGCAGQTVSVIPLSKQVLLTCKGTEYDVTRARILRGHTHALRNRIVARRAVFTVKGEALIWRLR